MKNKRLMKGLLASLSHRAILSRPRADVTQPSLSDINEAVVKMSKDFHAFKELNDKAIKDLQNKGAIDPVMKDQLDKLNKTIGDTSAKVDDFIKGRKEDQIRVDNMEKLLNRANLGGNGGGSDLAKNAKAFSLMVSAIQNRPVTVSEEAYTNYNNAFSELLRKGGVDNFHRVADSAKAALTAGDDSGGFLVPPDRLNVLIQRLFDTSPVRDVATIIPTSSDKVEIPVDIDAATSGGWVSEQTAPSTTANGKIRMQTIEVFEQYAQPEVSQRLLEDAAFPLENWIVEKAGDIMGRTENTAFVNGNGTGKPRGFMSYTGTAVLSTKDKSRAWNTVEYLKTGGAAGFKADPDGADALISLVHSMKPIYRNGALWAANRATFAAARLLKDDQGRYIWSMGDIQKGQPSSLLGYGTVEMEDMDDLGANAFPLSFANFKLAYYIVDRLGMVLLKDPYTGKPNVRFYFRKRVGGDIVNFDAIKYLKCAT